MVDCAVFGESDFPPAGTGKRAVLKLALFAVYFAAHFVGVFVLEEELVAELVGAAEEEHAVFAVRTRHLFPKVRLL